MARVFLDANIFIDLAENRGKISTDDLDNHDLFVSALLPHILMYITKRKVPFEKLSSLIIDSFTIVSFDHSICYKALDGPTSDFEDNVQLHSAAEAECDLFLTNDRRLLGLKFFGKARIIQNPAGL